MTPIADMVERMLADGVTAELIVLAIRAVETVALRERYASRDASQNVTPLSQTPGAIRARKSRANRKQNQQSAKANDVAERGAEALGRERYASRDGVTSHCDLSSFLSSSEGSSEKENKKGNARARGSRMQPGAVLTVEFRQAAIDLGADAARVPPMWAEFVDYWIGVPGSRGVKLDWLATWRNRVRDIAARGNRNGKINGARSNVASAFDDLIAHSEGREGAGDRDQRRDADLDLRADRR